MTLPKRKSSGLCRLFLQAIILSTLMLQGAIVLAHGTKYRIITKGIFGVKAYSHSGSPMKNARVLLYRPGETRTYKKMQTDSEGIVFFKPDIPGIWKIRVLDVSGHGLLVKLTVDANMLLTQDSPMTNNLSLSQKIIMIISIIWGTVGTVLFFKRK